MYVCMYVCMYACMYVCRPSGSVYCSRAAFWALSWGARAEPVRPFPYLICSYLKFQGLDFEPKNISTS